ncbi:MAG: hypothetical protein KF688_08725 [Pirellulales bacterium]|nr:hypothetical protein [Pirellulales bacterium]
MSTSSSPSPVAIVPESVHRESPESFLRWAIAELELPVISEAAGQVAVGVPEADRPGLGGREEIAGPLTLESELGRWLIDRLGGPEGACHARPGDQPMGVGEVSTKLFAAYTVDGGQFHLAGCQLTDHPFLRLTFPGTAADSSLRHVFVAPDGSSVGEELVAKLGLGELVTAGKLPPRIDEAALRSLVGAGRRIAAKQSTARDPAAQVVDPLAVTVVWVRHAEGRLQFEIGDASEWLDFSGWAKLLEPKPWTARRSGASTFHLAATDAGEIEAAEQIAVCQQSGRRVLRQDLVACSVTGRMVLPEFTQTCPVTGRPALRSEFAECSQCRQRVSRTALAEGLCQACRELAPARKDDPRLAWIFGEHRGLDRWNKWRLAETETIYVARADGLTKRLLVVVDKETLAVARLATASRFSGGWTDASESEQADLLR